MRTLFLPIALLSLASAGQAVPFAPQGPFGGGPGGGREAGPVRFAMPGGGRPMPGHRPDQDAAFAGRRAGTLRPLREIEDRVVPRMNGADYLGPEYDPGSGIYRLKFMRSGSVIWIDVDGRTGAIIGRRGN